jgi:hypothetical protein
VKADASATAGPLTPLPVSVAGRVLRPTPVFDTYWRFAAARQQVYLARLAGGPPPWTCDPILAAHRFTNCYRAADRVSQHLITQVSYHGDQAWDEIFFRTLLFRTFNRISTWRLLTAQLGEPAWGGYDFAAYDTVLSRARAAGQSLYSAAYIMPSPPLGFPRKHSNHLRLIELMMTSGAPARIAAAPGMRAAYDILAGYPGIGPFLAYQYLTDLNYSAALGWTETEFTVPGPGARDGIGKCFGPAADPIAADVIRYMADTQEEHFDRLGLAFTKLGGRRPLQLIDCQNLFCETGKYARAAHPDIAGTSGRTRIKQAYRPGPGPLTAWFPPRWGLNGTVLPPVPLLPAPQAAEGSNCCRNSGHQ